MAYEARIEETCVSGSGEARRLIHELPQISGRDPDSVFVGRFIRKCFGVTEGLTLDWPHINHRRDASKCEGSSGLPYHVREAWLCSIHQSQQSLLHRGPLRAHD